MKEKERELINKMTEIYTVSREKYQLSIPLFGKTKLPRRSLQFTLEERFLGLRASFIVVSTQIGGQQLLMKARLASIFDCHTNRERERERKRERSTRERKRERERERCAYEKDMRVPRILRIRILLEKANRVTPCLLGQANVFAFVYSAYPSFTACFVRSHSARLSHMLLHLLYFDL